MLRQSHGILLGVFSEEEEEEEDDDDDDVTSCIAVSSECSCADISAAELNSRPAGGKVTHRPGSSMCQGHLSGPKTKRSLNLCSGFFQRRGGRKY
jgi:hypothetical protein